MNPPRRIAYYVSAHGYGHGARSCDIIRALNRLDPAVEVTIVSDLPQAFLRNRIPGPGNSFRPGAFDVGLVQLDSLRADVAATLVRLEELYGRFDELVAAERTFIRDTRIGLVVVDIPAMPLQAARAESVPRVAVGNFGWNWIYSEYAEEEPRWNRIIDRLEEGYAAADLLLRLPFSEEMRVFPRKEDIPVVASPGRSRRKEIAALTGCSIDRRWVLLSFTTLGWTDEALSRVQELDGHEFFTVLPLAWRGRNIHDVDRERIPFSDIVASVDGVVSKPGFGIVSECAVNRKPLLYADRTRFLEYPLLESAIRRYLRHAKISSRLLYEGDLREALDRLWASPDPIEVPEAGGAELAARRLLGLAVGAPSA